MIGLNSYVFFLGNGSSNKTSKIGKRRLDINQMKSVSSKSI
jgi:hypothetical protein